MPHGGKCRQKKQEKGDGGKWRIPAGLNFENHRHDEGTPAGVLLNIPLEIDADFFFDDTVVGFFLRAGAVEGLSDHLAGTFHEVGLGADEAASNQLGLTLDFAAELVDGEDGKD